MKWYEVLITITCCVILVLAGGVITGRMIQKDTVIAQNAQRIISVAKVVNQLSEKVELLETNKKR